MSNLPNSLVSFTTSSQTMKETRYKWDIPPCAALSCAVAGEDEEVRTIFALLLARLVKPHGTVGNVVDGDDGKRSGVYVLQWLVGGTNVG